MVATRDKSHVDDKLLHLTGDNLAETIGEQMRNKSCLEGYKTFPVPSENTRRNKAPFAYVRITGCSQAVSSL